MATKSAVINTATDLPPKAEVPSQVQNRCALVTFVKLIAEREKEKTYVVFDLSLALHEGHRKWVLPRIANVWEALDALEVKSLALGEDLLCNVSFRAVPADRDTGMEVLGVAVNGIRLSTVEETGKGEAVEVTRLQFRVSVPITDQSWQWARNYFGKAIWFGWAQTQGDLFGAPRK